MRKRYQIAAQRAVREFRTVAAEQNPLLQLTLPLADIVAWLQEGVGHLLRQAGLQLMQLIMEEEVQQLAGDRSQPNAERRAWRWGSEKGFCVVDGQKVPIDRVRLRTPQKREQRLGSYELFRRAAPRDKAVWEKLMLGLSTRNYGAAVKQFADAYGVEKSVVSERFIQVSREKVKALLERSLKELRLCAMVIDGTPYQGHHMIVAVGIGQDGSKTILGFREGATENATVVCELLEDMARRGLDFTQPCLYVLDGAKALHAAVRRHAGDSALIQRCQLHKKRNVLDHLAEEHQGWVDQKLNEAYALFEYADARKALDRLHRELADINPSAARSLAEGLDETLTVDRLRVPVLLRKTLSSTNVIESTFSVVETVCRNVKRWRKGDHLERWIASGLLVAERKFRRVRGYREIPQFLQALSQLSQKGVARRAAVA